MLLFLITETTCGSFPGPGLDHVYSFNPMAEFIDRDTQHADSAWETYKRIHNKTYKPEHHDSRKQVFLQNMRYDVHISLLNLCISVKFTNKLAIITSTTVGLLPTLPS